MICYKKQKLQRKMWIGDILGIVITSDFYSSYQCEFSKLCVINMNANSMKSKVTYCKYDLVSTASININQINTV